MGFKAGGGPGDVGNCGALGKNWPSLLLLALALCNLWANHSSFLTWLRASIAMSGEEEELLG